jgi:hypothetical protein
MIKTPLQADFAVFEFPTVNQSICPHLQPRNLLSL